MVGQDEYLFEKKKHFDQVENRWSRSIVRNLIVENRWQSVAEVHSSSHLKDPIYTKLHLVQKVDFHVRFVWDFVASDKLIKAMLLKLEKIYN